MELREFMGVFRPLRRYVNFYGEKIGNIPVRLVAEIEVEINQLVLFPKKALGDNGKHKIQYFHVRKKTLSNLKELMKSLPRNILPN